MNNTLNCCGNGKPTLDIEEMPDAVAMLKYNICGVSSWYDYTNMIKQTQTDTSVSVDAVKRVLKYMAERHTDSISAKELGSILHLVDMADVDGYDVDDGSFLIYQKDSNCADGCTGINNAWRAWNALSNTDTSINYIMGFDEDGGPLSLNRPTSTNQYHLLGWNATNKVSYYQPTVVASAPVDSDNKKWALYLDPNTKAIVVVKES